MPTHFWLFLHCLLLLTIQHWTANSSSLVSSAPVLICLSVSLFANCPFLGSFTNCPFGFSQTCLSSPTSSLIGDLESKPFIWFCGKTDKEIRCYQSRLEWTWEWWQWRGTPHSPKLEHYWNFTIKLFSYPRHSSWGGVLPLWRDAVKVFNSHS